jgi:signal transduction histidine kinase
LLGQPTESDAAATNLTELLHRPDGQAIALADRPLTRAFSQRATIQEDALIVRPDGKRIPIFWYASPVFNRSGDVVGAVMLFGDISERKDLERLRAEWNAVIAHDLRQPVTVIHGFASLLAKEIQQRAPSERLMSSVTHILGSASRLNRMVGDLLDASRIEAEQLSIRFQQVDCARIVEGVVARSAEVTQGHPVRVDVQGSIPSLMADPERLEQVLVNLLSNAAKYSFPATQIQVSVRQRGTSGVVVAVSNHGRGISREELPYLFSRFHRTSDAQDGPVRGVGLGLYIARGLICAHGGKIWAESTLGQTTTFAFELPVRGDAASEPLGGPRLCRASSPVESGYGQSVPASA